MNRDSGKELDPLETAVRRALVDSDAIGDPDDLDRLAEAVVSELLKVEDGRVGWFLVGATEEVHQVQNACYLGPSGEEKESNRWDVQTRHVR